MIAAAKTLGIPARYVNGDMQTNSHSSEFQSTHAWAEFYINDLGWVGFDPTNKCSPDERYVRVSCGLDASYASPIKGVFYGNINNDAVIENLDIHVQTLENNSHCSEFQSTHAWAEFYINDLGWVGFYPTNKCSPDERYVRVSCGLDASYASPIKGVFYGNINNDALIENLDIHVQTLENNSQQ